MDVGKSGYGNEYRTGGGKSVKFAMPSEHDSQISESMSVSAMSR
jgi:hypothetical protein